MIKYKNYTVYLNHESITIDYTDREIDDTRTNFTAYSVQDAIDLIIRDIVLLGRKEFYSTLVLELIRDIEDLKNCMHNYYK